MNNENKDGHLTTGEGFGILCMLTAAFSILKLNGVIGWSWLWVLAPLWIPAAIAIWILLICLVVVLCCELLKGARK